MRLLVTGAWRASSADLERLREMGHEVKLLPREEEALPCAYDFAEGIVCNGLFLHHPIEKFTSLGYLQLTSAGFDRVPLDYVQAHHIEIHNARGVYSAPMAEFALAGILQLYKQSDFFRQNQRLRHWEKHRGLQELSGKNVLVLGCGSVGTQCAKLLNAFGCKVIGVDIAPREDANFQAIRPMKDLDGLLPKADVVILTLPLTPQTRGLFHAKRLALLKSEAILVNIARGGLIDQEALLQRLPELGGAVLDVFAEEPLPPRSPLWGMPNVILSPHNSFVGDGNAWRLSSLIVENLAQWQV